MNQESPVKYKLLLLFIMVVAFTLRFWNPFAIPFMYDELSALYRLRFDTFSELINKGITPDGHPAGVQVFLFYWTKVFGMREIVVKLPFLLSGVASIYITYLLGKLWFGNTNGVLSAVYISSLQMFVMYSQIARPYVSGLFICLLMVYSWSRYFFGKGKKRDLVFYIIFASLASYNHHFSLLFAAIVGVSGLWFVNKKTIIPYIISGVAIFILYIPHLPIFFSQLQQGGVGGVDGWLQKPDAWFLYRYLHWLFHYSFWVYGLFIAVILFFSLRFEALNISFSNGRKKRILLLIWFLLPIVIGFSYSILLNPVLQFSMLIFSTPFLFILVFSFLHEIRIRQLSLLVIIILMINVFTLIFTRNYYDVFYKQPFEQVVKNAISLEKENPENVMIVNDYVPFYTEYYFMKFGKELPYFTVRNMEITISDFRSILTDIKQDIIITSGLKGIYFQQIKEQFPYWIGYEKGFTYEQYVFARIHNDKHKELNRKLIAQTSFKDEKPNWRFNKKFIINDSISHEQSYMFYPEHEYGLGIKIPLNQCVSNIYSFIDIEVEIKSDDPDLSGVVVGEIKSEGDLISWNGANFKKFGFEPGKWQKVYLTIDMQLAMKKQKRIDQKQKIKVVIWNKNKKQFLIKKISVFSRPGNPERYAL